MAFPDVVANALCLELVNTVNNWYEPTGDALADPAAAASWAALVGAPLDAEPHAQALTRARALRVCVHDMFRSVAHGRRPAAGDLGGLGQIYATALRTARLAPTGSTYEFVWPSGGELDDLLARAAASAVELLTDGPLDRVGECPSCGWLFLDTSRNGRRRWCSMETCGARVKARRHYAARTGTT